MSAIKNFLSYVEISTKIASVFPFLAGTGYILYFEKSLAVRETIIFFAAMLLFDMMTTALNNHVGSRQTGGKPHYPDAVSVCLILFMGLSASVLGLYLVASLGDVVILAAGLFCFGVGIIYNYGPLPLARTPFGELFSGVVMGVCIPLIVIEINQPLFYVSAPLGFIIVEAAWPELLFLCALTAPLVCCIANIMLANNICDVEEDAAVQRYTLPFYIGVNKALRLYGLLYAAAYLFILLACLLTTIPAFTAAVLLTAFPVRKNVRRFTELHDKRLTFFTAIINFLMILIPYTACIWLGALIRLLLH